MTRFIFALGLATGLTVLPVIAQETPQDVDGNGTWSMQELKAAYPNLSEETFAAMDTSADGQIDMVEYEAATGTDLLTQ